MEVNLSDISWSGPEIDDAEVVDRVPDDLRSILRQHNGFVLHRGALHVHGACCEPSWHSLQVAWQGERAFCQLYPDVLTSDVPFAQDQIGDQYLLRGAQIIHLDAETGEACVFARSLADFFSRVDADIEEYLNVGLEHELAPGQLLHVYPPFCAKADKDVSLRPCPAEEVILFHANFAKEIREVPDGGQIQIDVTD